MVNSWGISTITMSDWKNCSRKERWNNMLDYEVVKETLDKILTISF